MADSLEALDELYKITSSYANVANAKGQKSIIYDPFMMVGGIGNTATLDNYFSYETMKKVSERFPVSAIISTRVDQVAAFCEPQRDIYSTGFVIKPSTASNGKLNKKQEKEIEYLTEYILNCGNEKYHYENDDFDGFIRKITKDSLRYDQCTFEMVWNNYGYGHTKGRPSRFLANDGSLFRIVADMKNIYDTNNETPSYAMLVSGNVQAYFYKHELCFGVRNKNTDISRIGYGTSEIETMMSELEGFFNAVSYNRNYFKNGSLPKSIIRISGNVNETKLLEFKQYWDAYAKGVHNAWRTPIIQADLMDVIDVQKTNKDMEFASWLEFLIKVVCAIYKIDPSEIGFPMSGSADAKPMFEGNNEARLKYSRDKGLYPLLKFIQSKINKYIMYPLTGGAYKFYFVGLDGMTREAELELNAKAISVYKTINEVRAEYGLSPIKGGDIIANPQYMQSYQAMMQGGEQSNDAMQDSEVMGKDWANEDEEENPFEKAISSDFKKMFEI